MAGKVTETAVVDQNNKVLGTQFFSTKRQGYRQILAWMTSFGCSGTVNLAT